MGIHKCDCCIKVLAAAAAFYLCQSRDYRNILLCHDFYRAEQEFKSNGLAIVKQQVSYS